MSFPDTDAARLHPVASSALRGGDAATALEAVARAEDPAGRRIAGRALLALGDREGARRELLAALADSADDPAGQALAHAALASVARAMGEPTEAIGHLEWALIDAPPAARLDLHREAATVASRAGLLADAEFHARAALEARGARVGVDETERAGDRSGLDDLRATADDRARLGAILAAQGRHGEAVGHLREATTTLASEVGEGHVDTLRARAELAEALALAGRTAESTTEHEAVLAGRIATLGDAHPELAPTLLALAALRATDDAARSRPAAYAFAARAVDLLEGRVVADDPLLAEARAAAAAWAP